MATLSNSSSRHMKRAERARAHRAAKTQGEPKQPKLEDEDDAQEKSEKSENFVAVNITPGQLVDLNSALASTKGPTAECLQQFSAKLAIREPSTAASSSVAEEQYGKVFAPRPVATTGPRAVEDKYVKSQPGQIEMCEDPCAQLEISTETLENDELENSFVEKDSVEEDNAALHRRLEVQKSEFEVPREKLENDNFVCDHAPHTGAGNETLFQPQLAHAFAGTAGTTRFVRLNDLYSALDKLQNFEVMEFAAAATPPHDRSDAHSPAALRRDLEPQKAEHLFTSECLENVVSLENPNAEKEGVQRDNAAFRRNLEGVHTERDISSERSAEDNMALRQHVEFQKAELEMSIQKSSAEKESIEKDNAALGRQLELQNAELENSLVEKENDEQQLTAEYQMCATLQAKLRRQESEHLAAQSELRCEMSQHMKNSQNGFEAECEKTAMLEAQLQRQESAIAEKDEMFVKLESFEASIAASKAATALAEHKLDFCEAELQHKDIKVGRLEAKLHLEESLAEIATACEEAAQRMLHQYEEAFHQKKG